ncbi:hypothetical protein ACFOYW_08855 [Gryllotalpicola reticulitermitis]|uniref:Uncharacterized protein n=1 Tax=Gryllotalpicola reticulitermitis TaxID=1184153 RepID=A0ABV8Q643_9MICO
MRKWNKSTSGTKKLRNGVAFAVTTAFGAAALVFAVPANAAPARVTEAAPTVTLAGGASAQRLDVINKKITKDYTNKSKQLSSCSVGTSGAKCSATANRAFTNTWQTSMGITVKALSTSLGFSHAATTAYSTTCHSPTMKKGQTWRMYPRGTHASYKIRKTTATQFRTTTQTSGTLTSFKASHNAIYCELK